MFTHELNNYYIEIYRLLNVQIKYNYICYLPRDTFDLWYIVLVIQLNYSLLFVSFF